MIFYPQLFQTRVRSNGNVGRKLRVTRDCTGVWLNLSQHIMFLHWVQQPKLTLGPGPWNHSDFWII